MQRIDAGYLYQLGDSVRSLRTFRFRDDIPLFEIWTPLNEARERVNEFLTGSVYTTSIRSVYSPGQKFLEALDALINHIVGKEGMLTLERSDLRTLFDAFDRFEPVLASELSTIATYLVQPKGAYDVAILIEAGERMFPQSIIMKCPEAVFDTQQGSKALAYELWTAAAFHFHRANESILRRYFDQEAGKERRPKHLTMGTLLAKLKQLNKGHQNILVALDNIKEFHRNPISHPGENLQSVDECLDLIAAVRAAMGYMLEKLPMLPFNELMEAFPNPNLHKNFGLQPEAAVAE